MFPYHNVQPNGRRAAGQHKARSSRLEPRALSSASVRQLVNDIESYLVDRILTPKPYK